MSGSGDRLPPMAACAVTANISPDSRDRRLPWAASTRSRLGQPRANTVPAPSSAPPIMAPDRLLLRFRTRMPLVPMTSNAIRAWVPTIAAEKTSSQMASFGPNEPRPTSRVAARRQNLLFCARKPNSRPITRPSSVPVPASPSFSMRNVKSMDGQSFDGASNRLPFQLCTKRQALSLTSTRPRPGQGR